MSILLTGSEGFIGKRLQKKLQGKVERIDFRLGLDLISCPLPNNIDVIYHLAAQTSVESSWYDPVFDSNNLRITARLVKEYPNAKIIYTASSATKDTSPYGFSKWASAEYIKNFHKNYVICTLPNVYGQKGGKSVVDIFKDNDEVTIYGDGGQTRSYVHVDDIVEALILAKDWEIGEYSLGDGKATTVSDLLRDGQLINIMPARKEAYEAVAPNTSPNWKPKINIIDYLNEKR